MRPIVQRRTSSAIWAIATVVIGGRVLGVVTQTLQGVLGRGWNVLANSGAIWLVGAFLLSAAIHAGTRASALAGWGVLLGALVGYYGSAWWLDGVPFGAVSVLVIWFLAACAGGPVFGIAGSWWRARRGWRHVAALALLGGVLIAEGIYLLARVQTQGRAGWVEIVAGLLVPLLLGRTARDRLLGLAGLPLVALLAYAVYLILNAAIGRV